MRCCISSFHSSCLSPPSTSTVRFCAARKPVLRRRLTCPLIRTVHVFKRLLGHAVTLAVPGLLAATSLTALVAKYVLPYDWDMNQALLMGTVLSATDPVAVVALLKELSVSERLATLIEGESLLNDGTAMVFFIMFRDAIVDHSSVGLVDVIGLFCKMSFGAMVRLGVAGQRIRR